MNMEQNIQIVPIEDIIPNRFQPRLSFNEEGLKELSESIKQHGIIQPLVVRKLGDKFEIIAGERRYKASTMAGLTKVPVIISNIDDNKSAEVALVENIQRRNLTAIEEAKSYKNLLDRGYLTQEQLADKMGVSQSTIANKLRLLNLDNEVQDALLNEKISERHARALLTLENKEDQKKWLKKIIDERMPVRQLDVELKKYKEELSNPTSSDEDDGGIPLVNINPDISEIMNNAHDLQIEDKYINEAPNFINIEPQPIDSEVKEEENRSNKFFNFMEEEPTNMTVNNPIDIFNTETLEEPKLTNPIEYLDEDNTIENEKIDEEEKKKEDIQKEKEELANTMNLEFLNLDGLIDPLDSIEKLDPNYEEKEEIEQGIDFKSTINTIRENVEKLKDRGINIEIEEADLAEDYQIIIKIKK